jgi:hydrogenase/urease accessory protein HupE
VLTALPRSSGDGRRARVDRLPVRALRVIVCRAVVAMSCLFAGAPALAHPVPFSYMDLRLQRDVIDATLVVHVFDAGHDLNIAPAERLLDAETARREAGALTAMLAPRFTVTVDGRALSPTWLGVEPMPDRQSLRLRFTLPLSAAPGVVQLTARMFPYDPQHQTFLNIYDNGALSQGILDAGHDRFEYVTGTTQGRMAVVRRLLPAGIEHILIGPDHVLFLIGLLLAGGTIRQLAFMVTAFTVAHSLTLSLAALNLLSPSPRIIEPAIALSIVYVGADNLLARDGRDLRVWIAFAFGLIHGFGFANVLREMALPRGALAWSLLSFNIGVEIGQVMIVVIVASLFAWLRARSETAGRQLAIAGSIIVIAAGAFWFVQRVFVPGGMS